MTRDAHDPRCERSTTKRCRCDCQGRLHGREASQIDLEHAAQKRPAPIPQQTTLVIHKWFEEVTR